jgi:ethanolamine utilization protein EutP (predicted NTPase)
MLSISYCAANLDIPICVQFIDTPGINDTDLKANSCVESVAADVIIFVINPEVSAVNQTQLNFIQQVILGKSDLKDIFFVFTHDDLVESEDVRTNLRKRVGSQIGSDQIFFVSNTSQNGIGEFKNFFYYYLKNRQETLLIDRKQRYFRQLVDRVSEEVKFERAALNQYKNKSSEEREKLLINVRDARRKESIEKNKIRERCHLRLNESLQNLQNLIQQNEASIETFISISQPSQLQQRGYLQQKIQNLLEQEIQPAIQTELEKLLKATQLDVQEGQQFSSKLLSEFDINLPVYDSPMARITSEQILPIAFLGSVALFGWLTVPTLLLGYVTLKARDLGLTRYADQTGLLDAAMDKVKSLAASSYKQAVKIAVAQTLDNYLNQITDHFREILEKVTDQAIKQINYAEEIENTLQKLRDEGDKSIIEREIRLDKVEALLVAENMKLR